MCGCVDMILINFYIIPLLWRSGYIYDRRTEEILQCNEKTWIQKATETYTEASGTSDLIFTTLILNTHLGI